MKANVGVHVCQHATIVLRHVTHCLWVNARENGVIPKEASYLKVWLAGSGTNKILLSCSLPSDRAMVIEFLQALSLYWESRA